MKNESGFIIKNMEDIEIIITDDGSIGLYNKKLDEIYHAKEGAKKEAFEKFIEPCLILNKKPLKILDICYGIGYNTKCALENFYSIELIDCIEIDKELATKSPTFEYASSKNINEIIEQNLQNPDFITFYFDDVRKIIKKLNKKYDIIFHDGFAPHKQSELWSEDLILEISKKLDKNGIYCTYNHSKPTLNALFKTGLTIGKTIKNNKTIGTVASFNKNLIQNPLNEFELNSLKTKSAITYRDKNLNLTHNAIVEKRNEEIKNSTLETLSHYLKNSKN